VLGVAFGLSVGTVLFSPAAGSALPAMVEESALVAANSGIWPAVLCPIVLAPAAGLLVVTFGFGWGFALNAVSYFASAALLRSLRLPRTVATAVRRRLSRDALEGARVLLADRLLRAMAIAQLPAALSAGATSARWSARETDLGGLQRSQHLCQRLLHVRSDRQQSHETRLVRSGDGRVMRQHTRQLDALCCQCIAEEGDVLGASSLVADGEHARYP